jgi:hypothetical protein
MGVMSGIRNGEQISLLAHGHDWGPADTPLSLEVSGNSLVLFMPANGQSLEMQPMNQDEYRERLASFAEALNASDVGLLPEE